MRKKGSALLLALVLTLCILPARPAAAKSAGLKEKAARMVELINEERKKAGVAPVAAGNVLLERAADIRAKEISMKFSHTRPDGTGPFTALDEVGLSYRTAGENIAYNTGYRDTVAQTMEGFMNSPGHRENILKESFREVGIGAYQTGNTYHWVQMFYTGSGASGSDPSPQPTPTPTPTPTPGPEDTLQPYPGTPFTDIAGHWGRDSIKWAYRKGLFAGVSATEFGPDQRMERGMLAEVLYRLAGKPVGHPLSGFTDVPAGAYYAKAVAWAAQEGIVNGVGENRFAPARQVSREELAVMLHRYAGMLGTPVPGGSLAGFTDRERVSPWAREAVEWAVGEGILTGKHNNRLDPQGKATRAEMAAMLERFAG